MKLGYLLGSTILILIAMMKSRKDYDLGLSIFNDHHTFSGIQIGVALVAKLLLIALGYYCFFNFQLANWPLIVHFSITILYSFLVMVVFLSEPIRNGVLPERKLSPTRINQIFTIASLVWGLAQLVFLYKIIKIIT